MNEQTEINDGPRGLSIPISGTRYFPAATGAVFYEVKMSGGIIYKVTKYPHGYNLTDGGEGAAGYKFSVEQIEKNRKWHIGKKLSEEHKAKMSANMKGRFCGESHPFFGKHHSDMTKQKMSKSGKGRKLSKEHKKKIGDGNRGKIMSPESIEKSRFAHLGIKLTEEHKVKLREAFKNGKKLNRRDPQTGRFEKVLTSKHFSWRLK